MISCTLILYLKVDCKFPGSWEPAYHSSAFICTVGAQRPAEEGVKKLLQSEMKKKRQNVKTLGIDIWGIYIPVFLTLIFPFSSILSIFSTMMCYPILSEPKINWRDKCAIKSQHLAVN